MAGEASFYLGLAAYYVGDFERAESAFRFLASHLPLTEVYNNLGVVAARRGKRLASEYFLKAVQADPNDPDYHFNLALALYRAGDAAGAARQLRETLNLRASDGEARTLLNIIVSNASSALNAHPVDAAQPRLPMERIKRNYDETSYRRLALDIQNAAETRLAQADPRVHGEYHVEQGRALLAQGFVPDAEKEFREAIILDPTNAAAHLGLARALEEKGEPAVARDEARTAVRLQPSAEAYLVLARLDLRENNLKPASDSVERALALEPSNNVALALRRTISGKMTEQAPQSQSVPR
jgi:Tfp pilus assembly protein PilF